MISQINMRMGELRRIIEEVQLNLRSRLCAISNHEFSQTLLGLSLELLGTSEARKGEKQNKVNRRKEKRSKNKKKQKTAPRYISSKSASLFVCQNNRAPLKN